MKNHRSLIASTLMTLGVLAGATAPAQANLLTNGSFETPNGGSGSYCYMAGSCTVNGWNGNAVRIANNSGAWGWPNQPAGYNYGDQLVGLQTSLFVSQTVNLAAGQHSLDWADSARLSYNGTSFYGAAQYQVLFNDVLLATYNPQAGEAWSRNTLNFTSSGGSGVLRFQGVDLNADTTAFIDDVVLTARAAQVPEPQSFALVALALLGLGAVRRRQRSR